MKWIARQSSQSDIGLLQDRLNVDLVSAKIMSGRGVSDMESARFYLENDISFLHNPFLFEDMETFCDRVLEAVENKEKVRVFGDRDVDGITSTSLMVLELRRLGLDVSYTLPMGNEPYGVTKEKIDSAVSDGVTLAITVDCGISCFDEIDYANTKGLDFLVTDHHIGTMLPPAVAVIDPKVEGSGYPFAHLAGVGVAAKCIWALRFAQTPYYKERFMLLHAYPGKDTVIIEAATIENLIETSRVSEEVVPGVLPPENSRLIKFLSCGLPIMVLDSETELIQMKKAFPKADISLQDLRGKFDESLPSVRGKSLFELSAISRFARYSSARSELDTLIGLFSAYVRATTPLLYRDYRTLTDLVAIGTVSDLMPMKDENRILVRNGLKVMEEGCRENLVPFLSMQNLTGREISATDIGWNVSPLMNASGRLGRPDVAVEMLLSSSSADAFEYATKLVEMNDERKKLGEKAWDRILPSARKSFEQFGSKFVVVNDREIPRGIAGIIATRLNKNFKAPSIVITEPEEGRCVGSMRSSNGFNCHDFLTSYAELFDDFGGHAYAGGFSLKTENVNEFLVRLSEDVDYIDCPEEEEPSVEYDAALSSMQLTPNILSIVSRFEPYGEENPPLVFMINGARLTSVTLMSNQKDASSAHLKFNLEYGSYVWSSVFWGAGSRLGHDFDDGDIVDVVFRVGRNYYRNQETIQITVLDMRRH
ncbi:MAG: single-stranded-DNA-specific exonuclease RecJ [Sphaerochaetaceae bacterium]|nr:single-stranded-DNA-specific exonuclease RecJ [Sphaerochaetaceae bacterium]